MHAEILTISTVLFTLLYHYVILHSFPSIIVDHNITRIQHMAIISVMSYDATMRLLKFMTTV